MKNSNEDFRAVNEGEENMPEGPNFFEEIRDAVADRLDDLATDPKLDGVGFPLDMGEKIRNGEKIERSRSVRDIIISVGQDFRLTPDEIDGLEEKFLEK